MEQTDLLRLAIDVLETQNVPYMLVGSYASGLYGEPRYTQDIDMVVELTPSHVGRFCDAFASDEFYLSREAVREAVANASQFNLLHPASGNKIDFMIAGKDAWGREQLGRRQRVPVLDDRDGYVARPEDVILSKMRYYQIGGSEKHLRDITGILKVSGDQVDRDYVTRWAAQLGVSDVWDAVRRRLGEA